MSGQLAVGWLEESGPFHFLIVLKTKDAIPSYHECPCSTPLEAEQLAFGICRRLGWGLASFDIPKEALSANLAGRVPASGVKPLRTRRQRAA